MNEDEIQRLIREAEEYRRQHHYAAAARCLEQAAGAAETSVRAKLWQEAAETWAHCGDHTSAGRCYLQASRLLEGPDKVHCLFACWLSYISGIVSEEYDCGFEWRGDWEEHESDHNIHHGIMDEYQRQAEKVLELILAIDGISKERILRDARAECARLQQEGGWGAARCKAIIASVEDGFM